MLYVIYLSLPSLQLKGMQINKKKEMKMHKKENAYISSAFSFLCIFIFFAIILLL